MGVVFQVWVSSSTADTCKTLIGWKSFGQTIEVSRTIEYEDLGEAECIRHGFCERMDNSGVSSSAYGTGVGVCVHGSQSQSER